MVVAGEEENIKQHQTSLQKAMQGGHINGAAGDKRAAAGNPETGGEKARKQRGWGWGSGEDRQR